jgi:PAS domain S-box-containing protein
MTAKRESRKRKTGILIVEDSPTQAHQLEQLFKENGFKVLIASNGKEALALLGKNRPDLVISDILMPEMDGYELCRQIKADEKFNNIPVILGTVLSEPSDIIKGLECGADNFVIKPYDEEFLLSRIHYVLSNRQIRQKERVQIALQVTFAGKKYAITSDRLQILNLLLSTYEIAVMRNLELAAARDDLKRLNEQLEDMVKERTTALAERVKELKCLYSISALVQKADSSLEKVIQDVVDMLPQGWQYPEVTCARVILDEKGFATANFRSTAWRQSSPILVNGEPSGRIEVCYLEERPECDEGPFLKEERKLIDDIARQLGGFVERQRAQEKLKHLNLVLRALRKVNQLITQENDTDRLIKAVCESLVSTRGYYSAWIALFDEPGKIVSHAEAGIGRHFLPLGEQLQRNELPACSRKALESAGAVIIRAIARSCADCPLAQWYAAGEVVTCRLEHGGAIYGTLTLAGPASLVIEGEEVELVEEVASDIALGISNIRRGRLLRASEEKYRILHEFAGEAIFTYGTDLRLMEVNKAGCDFVGRTKGELVGKDISELAILHPEDFTRASENIKKMLTREKPVVIDKMRFKGRTGLYSTFQVTSTPVMRNDEIVAITNICRNVTEEEMLYAALEASERTFRALFNAGNDAVYVFQLTESGVPGPFIEVNDTACSRYGYTREEMLNLTSADLAPPDRHAETPGIIKRLLEQKRVLFEWEHVTKDGRTFPVEISNQVFTLNKVTTFMSIVRDITERKKAEEDLKLLMAGIEQAEEVIGVMAMDSTIQYINPAIDKVIGHSQKEVLGQSIFDLLSPQNETLVYATLDALKNGSPWTGQIGSTKKDGSEYTIEMTLSPMRDRAGKIFSSILTVRDITQKLRMEERLIQSEKMEALGTLAGGVAHDFNNILSSVIGYAQLALEDIQQEGQLQSNLLEVLHAGRRGKDLVKQILSFSRQSAVEKIPIQISQAVKEALSLIRPAVPANIELRHNSRCESVVLANPTQISQIILNLCTNSAYAMGGSEGAIEVALEAVELDDVSTREHAGLIPGRYVRLTVSDTGPGIDPSIIGRIFDPFFTTKPKGAGTGMGLAVVHGIVNNLDGEISVDSAPGQGTTFEILLPAIKQTVPAESNEPALIAGGRESIIFVDDEPQIVKLGRYVLEQLGYQVLSSTNPIEALEAFRAQPDRFDLVISDVTMPKMTGDKLAMEIRRIRPDIPIILCTGFSAHISEETVEAIGVQALLMKPLLKREMAEAVRRVLDPRKKRDD